MGNRNGFYTSLVIYMISEEVGTKLKVIDDCGDLSKSVGNENSMEILTLPVSNNRKTKQNTTILILILLQVRINRNSKSYLIQVRLKICHC